MDLFSGDKEKFSLMLHIFYFLALECNYFALVIIYLWAKSEDRRWHPSPTTAYARAEFGPSLQTSSCSFIEFLFWLGK